jgi:predicted amidohydrolase
LQRGGQPHTIFASMPGKNQTIIAAAGQITARLMNEAPATLAAIDSAITRAAQMRVDLLVLPECAYPAYLLGSVASYRAGDHLTGQAYVDWLCERAERFRLHIVSGFIEDAGEGLHNAAVLIDAHGREVGRSRKRFLWNADHDWFLPGDDIRAFDSAVGRIGIVICAETRTPEILATLAADGAELIALPTCWINHARDPGQFRNPQVEYLIEARAREFGLPFICADKSGLELGAVGYVGASRIVRADGSVAAEAPPTGDAVIAARVVRQSPRRVWMTEPRRKALLDSGGRASRPPQGPQERSQAPNPTPSRHVKVAAVPAAIAKARQNGGTAEMLFGPLQRQGVQVVLANLPQESLAEHMSQLARAFDIHALGFPVSAEVFQLGPAKVGCVAGQWVRPAIRDGPALGPRRR